MALSGKKSRRQRRTTFGKLPVGACFLIAQRNYGTKPSVVYRRRLVKVSAASAARPSRSLKRERTYLTVFSELPVVVRRCPTGMKTALGGARRRRSR